MWTLEKIGKGFEKFITEHGHMPRAEEIDECNYLPSSRLIQKRFGGLQKIRDDLKYTDTHFGTGMSRSQIATTASVAGRQLESDTETLLHEKFGEQCVHTEKVFHKNLRVDFYIYAKETEFGLDVFNAATIRTWQSSVNIKLRKYQFFKQPLYLAVANDQIDSKCIAGYLSRRKSALQENITLINLNDIDKILKQYPPRLKA